jgi:hypothetical protein
MTGLIRGLLLMAALAAAMGAEADPGPAAARTAVDALHRELLGRFSDPYGLLCDYTAADGSVLLPTAAECRAAKPNGLAWWCPIENGAFFTGLWLTALVDRYQATGDEAVAVRARLAADGLLRLSSVGEHRAFIARGLAEDGRSHPPGGSDDQTLPWFYGLWRYLGSGIPGPDERIRVSAAILRVGMALRDNRWMVPSDPPSIGPRGGFAACTPGTAPRLLFIVRVLHQVSGDAAWLDLYRSLRDSGATADGPTRLALCADGDLVAEHAAPQWDFYMLWTKGHSVACLAALAHWEEDPAAAAAYRRGLLHVADFAAGRVALGGWDPAAVPDFQADWRQLLPLWREQPTMTDMVAVATVQAQAWDRISPRKSHELLRMAEPLFACWIVTLSGDEALVRRCAPAIRAALCRYPWRELRYSTCFAAELAWWQGRAWLE